MMNKVQEKVVELLRRDILKYDSYGHPEEHEYKRFKVSESEYGTPHVFVLTSVGRKNDDGTLGRNRRMIVIGPRGGVRSLLGRKVSGYGKVLIYGYEN